MKVEVQKVTVETFDVPTPPEGWHCVQPDCDGEHHYYVKTKS